jgi:hypothetical protein
LDKHCETVHKPLNENVERIRQNVEKFDGRLWTIVAGIVVSILLQVAPMIWGKEKSTAQAEADDYNSRKEMTAQGYRKRLDIMVEKRVRDNRLAVAPDTVEREE